MTHPERLARLHAQLQTLSGDETKIVTLFVEALVQDREASGGHPLRLGIDERDFKLLALKSALRLVIETAAALVAGPTHTIDPGATIAERDDR